LVDLQSSSTPHRADPRPKISRRLKNLAAAHRIDKSLINQQITHPRGRLRDASLACPFLPFNVLNIATQSVEALMADETESKASLQPFLSAHDQNDDLAGASVLTLLQRSAYMAEGNSQYAANIAKDLSRRLVASQARVAELRVGLLSWRSRFKSIEIDLNSRNSGSTRSPLSFRDGSRESHSEAVWFKAGLTKTQPAKTALVFRVARISAAATVSVKK
jgi:hypothetical protein